MSVRPRLTPAVADVRRSVREAWAEVSLAKGASVAIACSGGPDSLALVVASIFEARKLDLKINVVFVNHNLQPNSDKVAHKYAKLVSSLGADLVEVIDVKVTERKLGMEAAARKARYLAIDEFAKKHTAVFTMLGHTLDDQAETVLLGLARGSGAKSISGMPLLSPDKKYLRPLLGIRRTTTVQFCKDSNLSPWQDPQNKDTKFLRVKVRKNVVPVLEKELGPGVAEALARTAGILQEDVDFIDSQAEALFKRTAKVLATEIQLDVANLEKSPIALSNRVVHKALVLLGAEPSRTAVQSVMLLVTNWHGQKPLALPAVRVSRKDKMIVLKSTKSLKTGAC